MFSHWPVRNLSLSKNKQTSFNFRTGKALHTMPASHPRRRSRSSEELRGLCQVTLPEFGNGPWELNSILKSGFSPEVEPLHCAAFVL